MYRTKDQVALEIIAEGRRRGITPRGIVIAIATGLVESNLTVYANEKVPESLQLPHDAVGRDGKSVGVFQQQVVWGNGWWWGDAATCMDPTKSAGLFFDRLAKRDYNNGDPGAHAQAIQGSAFPDRYGQRMGEAQNVYDRLSGQTATPGAPMPDYGITKVMHGFNPTTPDNATGNSNGPRAQTPYVVLHTQQARASAVDLANFLNNSRISQPDNPVSYNLAVDDHDTIEVVPVNEGPWAAAAANNIGLHICFAGSYAEWLAGKWLETDASDGLNEDAMLTRGAQAAAAACQQYGIPVIYAGDGGRSGWPILPKGIVGHRDFGQRGGGHTDPGNGFPMDEFLRRVSHFVNGPAPAPNQPPPPPPPPAKRFPKDYSDRELLEYAAAQLGPGDPSWKSSGKTLRDKVWGV